MSKRKDADDDTAARKWTEAHCLACGEPCKATLCVRCRAKGER